MMKNYNIGFYGFRGEKSHTFMRPMSSLDTLHQLDFRNLFLLYWAGGAGIIELKHFLQDGYTTALSQKIAFFDEKHNPVRLPVSTCIVVIEKN